MESGRPFKISFALWTINNSIIVILFLYLLIVGIVSFVAGGLAGLLCFRKFKKYALMGFGNILTLLGFILIYNYVKKKRGEDIKYLKLGFASSFSIIFVLLLSLLPIILMFSESKTELWLVGVIASAWTIISWAIFLLIRFLLNKIGLKNRIIRIILAVILFIIFWVATGFLFSLFL